jgi:hypothetical protein
VSIGLYGVLSYELAQVIEVFATRAEAEAVVANWDRDEPDDAGVLEVISLELDVVPLSPG